MINGTLQLKRVVVQAALEEREVEQGKYLAISRSLCSVHSSI